ncbi:MAG: hypothetical protein FWD42_03820 [Solirubrobacterales bacterium]|nr:hypothetical protein [Solirubrobacterales bacterium]
MAGEVLFVGWGPVVRGREERALQVFQETMEYYGRLQQEGQIDSFEPVVIGPHGGDLAGFVMIRGERAKLAQLRFSEEFERMTVRAAGIVDNLGVGPAYTGEALTRQMGLFEESARELATA